MEYKNILIIKMSSLGDILHALPFAAALRERFPQAKISWLVHPQFAGFVPDAPTIDEVIHFDKVAFQKMSIGQKLAFAKTFRQELHARHFDLVVDLQGLFKSAAVAAMTGCANRIGYCEMREGSGLVSKEICGAHRHDHVIERYLDVARFLGAEIKEIKFPVPDLTKETVSVQKKLLAKGMAQSSSYVVIVPGARWETKEWPIKNYAEIAKRIVADGTYVVLAGGSEDRAKGAAVAKAAEAARVLDLTGQTSLRELAALIKGCRVYISGDTGPLHFAAALKKPLIAMYGPTKADRTGPYGSENSTVLLSPAHCVGCLKKHCKNAYCMEYITPDNVYKEYLQKIGKAEA